ncbi:acyltransferase family protein [Chitinophaga lutea]
MTVTTFIRELFRFDPGEKRRYSWIDYAKGIAIILVVYRHAAYGLMLSKVHVEQWVVDVNNALYSFRMPLFFVLSGLFFMSSIQRRGVRWFSAGRFNNLLYPYIVWSVIQITLQILSGHYANSQRTMEDYLNIIIQPRKLDQLWYLFALFNVSMLYMVTSIALKFRGQWQLVISVGLLAIAPFVRPYSGLYDIAIHYVFFFIGDQCARFFLSPDTQQRLGSPYLLILGFPVFFFVQMYYLRNMEMGLFLYVPVACVGVLYTIIAAIRLSKTNGLSFIRILGHYSLFIYLLHVGIGAFFRALLIQIPWMTEHSAVMLLIQITAAITASLLVYRFLTLIGLGFLFKGFLPEGPRDKQAAASPQSTQPHAQ